VADDDARTLLMVVLAGSESRPYVEGRVDADKVLREKFEAFAARCGRKATIGNFRRAFFALGRGERAVWTHDPKLEESGDVKMNQVVARFQKGLQHALYGTEARRTVIKEVVELLARRSGRAPSDLVAALAEICGAGPALLPHADKQAIA